MNVHIDWKQIPTRLMSGNRARATFPISQGGADPRGPGVHKPREGLFAADPELGGGASAWAAKHLSTEFVPTALADFARLRDIGAGRRDADMRRWLVASGRRMARKARFGQRPWEGDLAYADRLIATLKARA